MRINLNQILADSLPEPTPEQVAQYTSQAKGLFKRAGMRETKLVKDVLPHIGRILFDIGDSSLSIWSGGRPEIDDTGYAKAKGLMLAGSVGVGKTCALKVLSVAIEAQYFSVPELAKRYSELGDEWFWSEVHKAGRWDMVLDDLGAEEDSKHFGNSMPIRELIYKRYEMFQTQGVRTHVSTNISGKQIEERYGLRVRDRLREMMVVVSCVDKSLRGE